MKVTRYNRVIEEYTPRSIPRGMYRGAPTDTGTRILEAIRAAERRGEVPSVRELQATCNISSTSVVMYHLRQLARDGDIVFGARGTSRSYRLSEQGRGYPDDTELLARCLAYLERELGATGGALLEDLKRRLG